MGIVGGLDLHRKQITFDVVDTDTPGEMRRVGSVRRSGSCSGSGLLALPVRGWSWR